MIELIENTLIQLTDVLLDLPEEDYTRPCRYLGDETIGRHVRHIIDMFLCLENAYPSRMLCYEHRMRDPQIERSAQLAVSMIRDILSRLNRPDTALTIVGAYTDDGAGHMRVQTNYHRELLFLLEHTIHHMALIRIGMMELGLDRLPEGFGVAPATLQHRRGCAP